MARLGLMLLTMMMAASLSLTPDQIREYVRKHTGVEATVTDAAAAATDAAATDAAADATDGWIATDVAITDDWITTTIDGRTSTDGWVTTSTTAIASTEKAVEEKAVEGKEVETEKEVRTEGGEETEKEVRTEGEEETVKEVRTGGEEETEEEIEREGKAVEISTKTEFGRHNLLVFALVMVTAAGLGLSLCVAAIACGLARVERALGGSASGSGDGRPGQ